MLCPLRIHGTKGICIPTNLAQMYAIHVGKYTSPMDPMGIIWLTIVGGFLKTPFEKYVQIGSFFARVNIPNILPT